MTDSRKFTDTIKSKSQKAEKPQMSNAMLEELAGYEVSEDKRKTVAELRMDPIDYFLHLLKKEEERKST